MRWTWRRDSRKFSPPESKSPRRANLRIRSGLENQRAAYSWTTEPCTSPLARMADSASEPILSRLAVWIRRLLAATNREFSMSRPTPSREEFGRVEAVRPRIRITTFLWRRETGRSIVNQGGMSYSDSFLRFGTTGGLSVADYFTPCDQATLDSRGTGCRSQRAGPFAGFAGSSQPHLLIGGSKNGSLYVVNRDNMGGFDGTCHRFTSARTGCFGRCWGDSQHSVVLERFVYVAPGNGNLMSFPMSGGILAAPPPASQSPETLGPQGATPVISSNGTSNAHSLAD